MTQLFDLFANKKYKTQISELQQQVEELRADNQKLETKLDKRIEKTKIAIARKQEVEEMLNRAQQRITTLENELTTLREEASKNITFSGTYLLNKKSLEDIVVELSSIRSQSGTLHSIYFNMNTRISDFEFGDFIDKNCIYLFDQIKSYNGKVLFYDEDHCISLAIVPPFRIEKSEWITDDLLDLNPLKEMLAYEPIICVVYAHAGRTVVGIVEGSDVHADIVRTGVQAKHTKGGWSQRRFERGRDQDIEYHIKKVQEKLQLMVDDRIKMTIAGGDLPLARKILAGMDTPVIEKRIDVDGDPENIAIKVAWAGRLYRL
ncbi:MAG: Vms1/Ankzf1 family peptidyl-tRNA hydrolase [Euryarchaeota archaeon]|nr:Vms1/Ankzf1 family peptidyl-tRNA hydrolase [Euryarchaeota archaeon]